MFLTHNREYWNASVSLSLSSVANNFSRLPILGSDVFSQGVISGRHLFWRSKNFKFLRGHP